LKILAIDIGAGTQDILLYDTVINNVENCIKMVLPSPCLIYAERIRTLTKKRIDLFIQGNTIGGGPIASTLQKHIESNLKVYMTENAAYTLRNNLEQVKKMGIEIVLDSEIEGFKGETLVFEEVNIKRLQSLLNLFRILNMLQLLFRIMEFFQKK
jgi:uncharacterized protein (DUF1786 family)